MSPGVARTARRGTFATLLALLLTISLATDAFGLTWRSNSRFTTGDTGWAYNGGLAVSSPSIAHGIYERWTLGSWHVMYQRTTNGGSSWASAVRLSRLEAEESGIPAIDAYGSGVNAAWVESDDLVAGLDAIVVTRRSGDSGATWTDQVQLSPTGESAGPVQVARYGSRVAVVWTDQLTGRVYLRRSSNGGASWASRQLVATTSNRPYGGTRSSLREGFPSVAVASGVLYVSYFSATRTLKVRRSVDSGATFKAAKTLATNAGSWSPSSVAARGSTLVVGYAAVTSTDTWTVLRRSTDKGASWGSAISLNAKSSYRSWNPVVSVRGTRWMAVYEKCTSSGCGASYVYYRASTNGGRTWSAPIKASVRTRAWGTPADVDVATRTLVLYVDYNDSGNDVYLRAGS
jgi:hypothetical protein